MRDVDPIHAYVPGRPGDPRRPPDLPPGVVAHHGPPLHPDDVAIVDGVPVTSVARTLIDLAEVMDPDELRDCFAAARERGLLDLDQIRAAGCGSNGGHPWRSSTSSSASSVEPGHPSRQSMSW